MQQIYVGRQAIYDRNLKVHAYELLYRSGIVPGGTFPNGDQATCDVLINTLIEIGIDKVVGDRLAYINLTRGFILGHHPIPFPPERCVLEILEDVEIDDDLLTAVKTLSQQGFKIALDDYLHHESNTPLLKLVHRVKIDLLATDRTQLPALMAHLRGFKLELIAEKVETQSDFDLCNELGFDYFQGYFLCRPKVLNAQRIPGNRMAIQKLLARLQSPEADIDELAGLITQNVTLSYKIMRYVNSAYLGLPRQLSSVREAVVMLGQQTIRNLAALMLMNDVYDKPDELIRLSMTRAKMCEALAPDKDTGSMFFTVGLFSTLDALLDAPMDSLLESLPLNDVVKHALLAGEGLAGQTLSAVIHYERGEWDEALDKDHTGRLTEAYLQALDWTDNLFSDIMN